MIQIFGKNKTKNPSTPEDIIKRVRELEENIEKLTKETESLRQALRKAVTKIGMVRFNPFREIGGDQSFSLSLLDQDNNGIVMTSHYAIENQRVYAKPIQNGTSDYSLSKEEREAVEHAIKGIKKNDEKRTGKQT